MSAAEKGRVHPAPSGDDAGGVSAAALLRAMPINSARKLQDKVDKNHDGVISASEIGDLFHELEVDEEKISHLRTGLVLAVVFLGISIASNFGTAMYAAENARTTGTVTDPAASAAGNVTLGGAPVMQSKPSHELTDKDNNVLRTDRSSDELGMTSQLPDKAFNELESIVIKGPTGTINFRVHGWARYIEPDASRCGSVVVLYTIAGHITFDGVAMSFDEEVLGAFGRAGFSTEARRVRNRRDASSDAYALTGIEAVVGMFKFVAALDTSSLRCGDDIPSLTNNPFEGGEDILLTQTLMFACGIYGQPVCPANQELETIKGVSYFKRRKAMQSKLFNGKWSSVARVTFPEFDKGSLVTMHHDNISHAYTEVSQSGACVHSRQATTEDEGLAFRSKVPDTEDAAGATLEFINYDVLNGEYVRHYKVTLPSIGNDALAAENVTIGDGSPEAARTPLSFSMYEHYGKNRLYSLAIAAPGAYTTYDEIKVNPTAADLTAAGLGAHNFLNANTAAEALAVVEAATSGCEFVETSLEFNRTDLHSYKDHPWSSELDEEAFREYASLPPLYEDAGVTEESGRVARQSGCDEVRARCCSYNTRYDMVPGITWGTTPTSEKEWHKANSCDDEMGGSGLSQCPYSCGSNSRYSCQVGQGQYGKYSSQNSQTSGVACAASCDSASGCIGFDFTSKPGLHACRLYGTNTPRIGDGGSDNRQYCQTSSSGGRVYSQIHTAADCCRSNGAEVGSLANGDATTPSDCEALCDSTTGCSFFSHSTTWENCIFCSACDFTTTGSAARYTSWGAALSASAIGAGAPPSGKSWGPRTPGYCRESNPDPRKHRPDETALAACQRRCTEDSSCAGITYYGPSATRGWANKCFLAKPSCTPAPSSVGGTYMRLGDGSDQTQGWKSDGVSTSYTVGPLTFSQTWGVTNGIQHATFKAEAKTCFPTAGSACGNPHLYLSASLFLKVATDPNQCEAGGTASIGIKCNILGTDFALEASIGFKFMPVLGPQGLGVQMVLWAGRKFSIAVGHVEAKIGVMWNPPWRVVTIRSPNGAFAEVEACFTFVCGSKTIPISLPL